MNTLLSLLGIPLANAQAALPPPLCGPLPGCGGPANVLVLAAIPEIARVLLNLAVGLALLFVMVGGARYILNFGRDSELEKAKTTIFWALAGLVLALASHRIVTVIITEPLIPAGSNDPVFSLLQSGVRILLLLLNVTFLLVVVLGGMRMVYARGQEDEVTKGRIMVAWAVIGVLVINVAPLVVKAVLNL